MRLTLFWTFFYSTIGFTLLTIFNVALMTHPLLPDSGLDDNIFVNQQLTHIIGIVIMMFLFVHFYYEKHPRGQFSKKQAELHEEHPEIPKEYFQDPSIESVEDRSKKMEIIEKNHQQELVNDNTLNKDTNESIK